jgi:hypothetical protein
VIGLVGIERGSRDGLGSRMWPEPTAHFDPGGDGAHYVLNDTPHRVGLC